MTVEMTSVLDVERRNRIRQEDVVQVLNDRVVQQREYLQQYKAVVRSQIAARSSGVPQIETNPNQGNNYFASTS